MVPQTEKAARKKTPRKKGAELTLVVGEERADSSFRRLAFAVLILCGLAHAGLALYSAHLETPTVDEFAHVPAGLDYWKLGAWNSYSKNPPLVKLWITLPHALGLVGAIRMPEGERDPFGWGPWLNGMAFERDNAPHYLRLFFVARVMVVMLSLLTGVLIFIWAKSLAEVGLFAAVIAAAGFWFSPTVLAHAHLGTIDAGVTLVLFVLGFYLKVLPSRPRPFQSLCMGGLLGLALTAKFSAVFVLPWFLFVVVTRARSHRRKTFVLSFLSALVTIHAVYGFTGSFVPLDRLALHSTKLQRVASFLPPGLPVPLPRYFVEGFAAQVGDTENGEFGNYLFGRWSQSGWWNYNLVAVALKEHPLTLALLLLIPFALRRTSRRTWVPLVAPLVCVGVPMLFFNSLQVGIRYLLPLFPFLFVLLALVLSRWKRIAKLAPVALVFWGYSAVSSAPDYLSYFNIVAKQIGEDADLLLDSNLDWGQDLYRLKGVGKEGGPLGLMYFGHVDPKLYGIQYQLIPNHPVRGILAVSANLLKGMAYPVTAPDGTMVPLSSQHLAWLRAQRPIRRLGSIYLFDTRALP